LNNFAVSNEQRKTSFSGIVPVEMENLSMVEQARYFFSRVTDPRSMDRLEGRYQTPSSTIFSIIQKKPGN
jgi:hypothetical protein